MVKTYCICSGSGEGLVSISSGPALEGNDSLKSYRIAILFLTMCVLHHGASIALPDDTPKSTISKENNSFNIFQDHFYNKCY